MSLDQISTLPPAQQELILDGPALEAPAGIVPNFEHPPNRNDLAHLTNVMCLIFTVFFACVRAYAKIFCVTKVHIEDVLALLVFGTYVGCIYCNYWMMGLSGLFVHQWDVQVKHLWIILRSLHIGTNLCAVTIMVIKASILLEWNRLFVPRGTRNAFFWTCHAVLWTHTLFHGAWIIAENLSCIPHDKIWDKTIPGGACIDSKALYLPAAAINLVSDVIILVLPQKIIWGLHASRKTRIGVSLVFTIGILACISAAFRLYETAKFYQSDDTVYTMSGMYLWALAEMTCLFLVFCVPTAPKVFMAVGKRPAEKLVALFKSWTGLSLNLTKGNTASSRPRTTNKASNLSSNYRKVNENGMSLTKRSTSDSTEYLQEGDLGDLRSADTGILCTTQVTVEITPRDGSGNANFERDMYTHDHPWIDLT